MIRLQIVERPGANLYRILLDAMHSGALRTFVVAKRGRKVSHTNPNYPGWMNWSRSGGVITCEIISPRKQGAEWKFLSAFIGRLADRYADRIHSISLQFVDAHDTPAPPASRKAPARRRHSVS